MSDKFTPENPDIKMLADKYGIKAELIPSQPISFEGNRLFDVVSVTTFGIDPSDLKPLSNLIEYGWEVVCAVNHGDNGVNYILRREVKKENFLP